MTIIIIIIIIPIIDITTFAFAFGFADPEAFPFSPWKSPSLCQVVMRFYVELVKTCSYVSKYIFIA